MTPTEADKIDATFRNGSLTAVSVILGFSLSFLTRWAGLPGPWSAVDLFALAAIVIGIVFQVCAVSGLLLLSSLLVVRYRAAIGVFLAGLALVVVGVALAIAGDIGGYGQRLLGG